METPKISVIIPVYNVEDYLPKCVDSVLAQVEQDFEVLLVDDGSTDNCSTVCDEYHQKDGRIKVFHKPNGGLSSARNLGLDNAKGEWVFFLDSDDYIDENELTIPEEYKDADVIAKPIIYEYGTADSGSIPIHRKHLTKNRVYAVDIEIWRMFTNSSELVRNAVWSKLFRHELIGDLRFDVNAAGYEDLVFTHMIISKIHKYAFSDIGAYYYVQRSGSIVHNDNTTPMEKVDRFFDDDGINEWYLRPMFVKDFLANLASWMLHHKYIRLLSKERIGFIEDFLNGIGEQDRVLFTTKDYKALRKAERNLNLYLNDNAAYKFVILKEKSMEVFHKLRHLPKYMLKMIYYKVK